MNLHQLYLTRNDCYQAGKTHTVRGIMVHSTGANNPYIRRYVGPDDGILGENAHGNHWNRPGLSACVHAFIGKVADGTIATYQTLPWEMAGWHSGDGSLGHARNANNTGYIGFEICEDDLSDGTYFVAVYREAVELCADLCREYGLDPATAILCHSEGHAKGIASNHADVMHWFPQHGKSMDTFRADVAAQLRGEEEKPAAPGTYTVVAGDSLSKIGAKLGVPWKEIAAANGIEDPWIIRPGQVLTIPGGSGETGDGETAEKPAAHNPYAEPTALLQSGSRGDGVRWVQWELDRLGYDLGSGGIDGIFGAKTDAGVRAIQKAAGIAVDGKVGPDTRKALKNAGGSGGSGAPDQPSKPGTYTVATGDSLSKIGANLGVPWKEIAAANGIEDPWIIRPGQVLTIPGGAGAPNKPSKPGTYTVAAGDSLSKIGANLGVPWKEIAAANGIEDPWIIRPGQVLTIPER